MIHAFWDRARRFDAFELAGLCHTVEVQDFVASNVDVHVTDFAPHKTLKSIAQRQLDFC